MTATVTPAALHAALREGGELALLDLREQGVFGRSHILLATNLPLSRLELRLRDLVPRPATPVVLCDGGEEVGGESLAERAAAVLAAAGYADVRILEGGVAAWGAAGFELFSGINVPSKAFGEVIEQRHDTPDIGPEELKAKLDAGEDLVILDSRPFEEYRAMNIPGGIDTPGAELVYRIRDLAPDPRTLVVVNCAGRTRSIIGAQSLINAGVPNPVVALRNGTMGWHLAGFELERGAGRRFAPVGGDARSWARAAAAQVGDRFGVKWIDPEDLRAWQAEAEDRTLYLLDVRDPEEYAAGHLPGSLSAPGGQLVQATDRWIAVRAARIVLIDDSAVRATMTASWLNQMGFPGVAVLAEGLEGWELETGPGGAEVPELAAAKVETLAPEALRSGENEALVVDLGSSLAYRAGHIPGAAWAIRARLAEVEDTLGSRSKLVFTSEDGRLAKLAAAELAARWPKRSLAALEGGTAAWAAAGLPLVPGMEAALHPEEDVYHRPYDRDSGVEAAMRAYLDWEVALTEQIEHDGTLRFPEFPG